MKKTTFWIAAALLSTTLSAQDSGEVLDSKKTTFNPELSISQRYTDNVLFIDTDNAMSDSSTRIRIRLPVVRRLRNGTLTFAYGTGYDKYKDSDDLDNAPHRLSIGYSTKPGRFSSLNLSGSYSRSQDQALLETVDDEDADPSISDPFLSQRTKRESYGARVRYQRKLGRRWSMNSHVRATENRFTTISGAALPGEADDVEDRTTYGASFGASRSLTQRTSIGLRYRYDSYDLASSADETVQRLGITIGHSFSERFGLDFSLGGYQRSEDLVGGGTEDDTGAHIGVNARFNEGLQLGPVRLSFFAGIRPSAGVPYGGTSTNSSAGISISRAVERPWDWSVSAKYSRRDPSRDTDPEVSTFSVGPSLERRFRKLFGVRFSQRYVDQNSSNSDRNNGSFHTFSVSLVWYPLGRTRVANR